MNQEILSDIKETQGIEVKSIRFFRHPVINGDYTCIRCGKYMKNHGWINKLGVGYAVCPITKSINN